MAQTEHRDLILKFVGDNGAIAGETQTDITLSKGPMTSGFQKGSMFEIDSFTFKTGLVGNTPDPALDQLRGDVAAQQAHVQKLLQQHAAALKLGKIPGLTMKSNAQDFAEFRSGKDDTTYPVDLKPIEFTRGIDKSSPTIMRYCINRKVFQSASLIKRKAAGSISSGEVFLRFDFNTVLVTQVGWDNDDPVKENVEFVCRAVTIHYLPQLPDGTLGAPIQSFWAAAKGLTATNLS